MTGGPAPDDRAGDDRELRAAEYVLGTLPAEERAAVETLRTVDPLVEAAVQGWERRLTPLALSVPEVPPPTHVWDRIAQALVPAAIDPHLSALRSLRGQVRRWRFAATGTGLLAAGLALSLASESFHEAARPERYLAVVQSGGALPALIVSVDVAAGNAQVRPVGAETPAGRSLELWYVAGSATPRPLGLVGASPSRIALPAAAPEGVLAVSVEPPGGSPTGQPTGPVIYTGKLIRE